MRRGRQIPLAGLAMSGLITVLLIGCGSEDTAGPAPPPQPEPARPTAVTVSPATAELTAFGATVQLSAEVRDQNGRPMTGAAIS
ncbi:hypothetical protein [Candidatus Palauibacter sp.]|uniref:hypothetical protein n=1 Tax=Candidatus Palauibacter sp. TaxID=3101350 RepID=UPI003B5BAAF9